MNGPVKGRKTNSQPQHEMLWVYFEWVFWPALLLGFALLTATADFLRDTRVGVEFRYWTPFLRELISSGVILAMMPGIVFIARKFSWRAIGIPGYLALHILLSLPFTFIHIIGTITVRFAGTIISGPGLDWDYIFKNLIFEYPKDLIVYVLIIVTINIYTWVRRSTGQADQVAIEADTLPVKTFTGIALIKLSDVEWIEAAKNYVVLHLRGKEYFLRTPIKNIEHDFARHGFLRIHRSAIVNLAKVKEIHKSPPRDSQAVLVTGKKINIGRQYKDSFDKNLGLKIQN